MFPSLRIEFLVQLFSQLSSLPQNIFIYCPFIGTFRKQTFLILRYLQELMFAYFVAQPTSARCYFVSEKLEYCHRRWISFKLLMRNWQFLLVLKDEVSLLGTR